jgi:hypothetical protein
MNCPSPDLLARLRRCAYRIRAFDVRRARRPVDRSP